MHDLREEMSFPIENSLGNEAPAMNTFREVRKKTLASNEFGKDEQGKSTHRMEVDRHILHSARHLPLVLGRYFNHDLSARVLHTVHIHAHHLHHLVEVVITVPVRRFQSQILMCNYYGL